MKASSYIMIGIGMLLLAGAGALAPVNATASACNNKVCTEIHTGGAVCLAAQSPPETRCDDGVGCSWDWCEPQ
jgi:hypothetical protein